MRGKDEFVTVILYRGGEAVKVKMRRAEARARGLEIAQDVKTKVRRPNRSADVSTKGA